MEIQIDHTALARFDDRYTMVHERSLSQPIERVFGAVTSAAQLDVWIGPTCRVEPKLYGACSFSWGGPEADAQKGLVTRFEPPVRVRYQLDDCSLQFGLESAAAGTRLTLTQAFDPEFRHDPDAFDPDDKAASLPAGADTPWRPGFVAGFHILCDTVGPFLSGEWTERDAEESTAGSEDWQRLVVAYVAHLRDNCPQSIGASS